MKHLLPFQLFEARASRLPSGLTPRQEAFLNRYTQGTWSVNRYTRGTWSVNPGTGLVDVRGSFDCSHPDTSWTGWRRGLKSLQGVSFGHVSGDFYCAHNQLTTLVGAPQTVDKNFSCGDNDLSTLEGAPQTVGGGFYCGNNQLTTLEGAPQTVGWYFWCDVFRLGQGEWNPSGWEKILSTGNAEARKLIVTLPFFDSDFWLQRLSGDLKKDGQVLLQLAALWEEPGWAGQRREIEQGLSPEQLRVIKALRTKLDYVNPWQDGVLTDI